MVNATAQDAEILSASNGTEEATVGEETEQGCGTEATTFLVYRVGLLTAARTEASSAERTSVSPCRST